MDRQIINTVNIDYDYEYAPKVHAASGSTSGHCVSTVNSNVIVQKTFEVFQNRVRQFVNVQINIENQSKLPIEIFLFDKLPKSFVLYPRTYRINRYLNNVQNAFDGYRVGVLSAQTTSRISYVLYNTANQVIPSVTLPQAQVMNRIANGNDNPDQWTWDISE
jgi:hypothetical protein